MPTQLTVLAVLLAALAGTGWLAYHQTEQRAVAEARIKDAQAAGDAWRLALDQQTAYAKDREQKLAESTHDYDRLRRTTQARISTYEQAARQDAGTGDWDAGRVPPAVSDRLCEYRADHAGEAGLPSTPETVHGPAANPCPGSYRYFTTGDLWRFTEELIETVDRAQSDRAALGVEFHN